MSLFEVIDVSIAPEAREELLDVSIDRPAPGESGDVYSLRLEGWLLGRGSQPVRLDVTYRNRVIHSMHVERSVKAVARSRPELLERHPDLDEDLLCGFVTLVGVLGLPPEFELGLSARLADDRTVPLGRIKASHEPLRAPYEPQLQPLMVTGPPRSGTTWLMKVLAGHPEVVVYDAHPYETWPAKYWTHALMVLTNPADPINSTRTHGLDANPFQIGHNPFFTVHAAKQPQLGAWLCRDHVEKMAAFFLETIDDWYLTLARAHGIDRPRYFAEKQMHRLAFSPVLMWELYPRAKEVFLVRDFRDLACSHISFSTDSETGETRGKLAGKEREEYVRRDVRGLAEDLRDAWRARKDRAHLMRYEDLVLRPNETLPELLAYLELEGGPETISAMLDAELAEGHVTSPDAKQSVGRWRREDEAFQALCSEVFKDLLEEFGYGAGVPSASG